MKRNIENIFLPPPVHWVGNGFRVHSFFPGKTGIDLKRMSPFFLLDYGSEHKFPPSDIPRGVGSHPHRGIETVTISYQGKVAHEDSAGNKGVIGENDVQWMTAGGGILHKEFHENEFNKQGGLFQMVQLWVNLPKKYKMTNPKYQDLLYNDASKFISDNKKVHMNIIAGEYNKIAGKAETFMPVNLFDISIEKDSKIDLNLDQNHNTGFLVIDGNIEINGKTKVDRNKFILFENDGNEISIKADSNAKVLVMSGEPINEPIAPYGPFVMNTREEIYQAIEDFNNGKFGHLE
jgi:redox-sensitive bicupin YhaK (pirin superfamily)